MDGNLSTLELQLAAIEHSITIINSKPLKELITRENINSVFSITHSNEIGEVKEFNEIKSSEYFDLLKFLIRNGYIDETYNDYMTYFYEDSISANDKTFLRRITDRRGAEYTYSLREPLKVIASPVLRTVDFEQEETLNFDLLECLLLNNHSTYAIYLKTLINQIKETSNFEFVSKFYDTDKAHKQFVIKLNEQWPEFFSRAWQSSMLPTVQIRQYSIDTLYSSSEDTLTAVNIDHCLTEYISSCSDYLNIEQPIMDKLISGFLHIDVHFATINYDDSHKELFHAVYEHSLYTLTFSNIALMLQKEYGIQNSLDIIHKNFTLVCNQDGSPLARYISENISTYVEIVLANCNDEISDREDIAISLLNNVEVTADKKEHYIDVLLTIISDITLVIESNLWPIMIDRNVVVFSESNFTNYFQKYGLDNVLIKYLNDSSSEIDFSKTSEEFGDEVANKLFDAVATCNGILTQKYEKLLTDLNYFFDEFTAENIDDDKFEALVRAHILTMDSDTLKFVREKYPKHLYRYIKFNLDEYLTLQTAEIFRIDEALEIITWNIPDKQKIDLLTFADDPISIVEVQYPDAINAYILKHNFNEKDRNYLYAQYPNYGENTQMEIVTLAKAGIQTIISNRIFLDNELLSVLLLDDTATSNQKILLFKNAISSLNEDSCKKHFDEMGLPDLKGIFSKGSGRRNYEKSDEVTKILEALKENKWIYEYRDDERNPDRYIVVKNKPKSKEPDVLD